MWQGPLPPVLTLTQPSTLRAPLPSLWSQHQQASTALCHFGAFSISPKAAFSQEAWPRWAVQAITRGPKYLKNLCSGYKIA